MAERSAYQEKIIRNYYSNRDDIMQQKLGDLVSDLYLAEGKKRDAVWKRVGLALKNLGVPEDEIERLTKLDDPAKILKYVKN